MSSTNKFHLSPQPIHPTYPSLIIVLGGITFVLSYISPLLLLPFFYILHIFVSYTNKSNDDALTRRLNWNAMIKRHDLPPWFKVPDTMTYTERYWVNSRGMALMTTTTLPKSSPPKALVLFCHGYSDQSCWYKGCQYRALVDAGFGLACIEYEGHGRSDGHLVSVPDWSELIRDVGEYARQVKKEVGADKIFIAGESMGGAVVYDTSTRNPGLFDGAVLVCPMCAIHDDMKPPSWVINLFYKIVGPPGTCGAVGMLPLAPSADVSVHSFKLSEKRMITEATANRYDRKPRLATARELLDTTDRISKSLHDFDMPFIVMHGEDDKVTDPELSKMLYDTAKSKDKTIKLYPGMWHTMTTGEPDDNCKAVFSDMIQWLSDRC